MDIGVVGKNLARALKPQVHGLVGRVPDDNDVPRPLGHEVRRHDAPLSLVVGRDVETWLITVNAEVDHGNGQGRAGMPVRGLNRVDEHARDLRAHKVAVVVALEVGVAVGVGNEQVIAVFARLGVGTVGNLQAGAVVEARQHEPERGTSAAGEHAGAVVGRVAEPLDGLLDKPARFGPDLLGVVERVGYRAERNARLARNIDDLDFCHGSPRVVRRRAAGACVLLAV